MRFPCGSFGKRRPTEIDFDEWMETFYNRCADLDEDDARFGDHDWNSIALGFLVARGVDPLVCSWEILSSFTCGDLTRFRIAYVDLLNAT